MIKVASDVVGRLRVGFAETLPSIDLLRALNEAVLVFLERGGGSSSLEYQALVKAARAANPNRLRNVP